MPEVQEVALKKRTLPPNTLGFIVYKKIVQRTVHSCIQYSAVSVSLYVP